MGLVRAEGRLLEFDPVYSKVSPSWMGSGLTEGRLLGASVFAVAPWMDIMGEQAGRWAEI